MKPSKATQLLDYVWNNWKAVSPLQRAIWEIEGEDVLRCTSVVYANTIRTFQLPPGKSNVAESYSPSPVKRIAQIITGVPPVLDSSAISRAQRIYSEQMQPLQATLREAMDTIATITAENAELKERLERAQAGGAVDGQRSREPAAPTPPPGTTGTSE